MPAFLLPILLNRYTIGAAVAFGLLIGAYFKGYSAASVKCHDAQLRAEIASLTRDLTAARIGAEIDKSLSAEIAANNARIQQEESDYELYLAQHPGSRCNLSDDDVRRINGLH